MNFLSLFSVESCFKQNIQLNLKFELVEFIQAIWKHLRKLELFDANMIVPWEFYHFLKVEIKQMFLFIVLLKFFA